MSYKFYEKTWPELKEYVDKDALIILPVGEMEEHSLYLPVDSDARISTFIAERIADEIGDEFPVLVMPTVWSGYTPAAVRTFPGGMGLHPQTFIDMMYGICSSIADMGFKKLFMLDGHGQHAPMLNIVTKLIADEYKYYYSTACYVSFIKDEFNAVRKSERGGCSHAGEMEASLIMYISPELVKTDLFTDIDKMKYQSKYVAGDLSLGSQKVVWSTFGREKTTNGALGDPTLACAETGKVVVDAAAKNIKDFLADYYFFDKNDK